MRHTVLHEVYRTPRVTTWCFLVFSVWFLGLGHTLRHPKSTASSQHLEDLDLLMAHNAVQRRSHAVVARCVQQAAA